MRSILLIPIALMVGAGPASAAEPIGEWAVENNVAHVRIDNCGGALWGVVSWEAKAGRDTENPDPALRGRPTLGMPILINMREKMVRRWNGVEEQRWEGQIYNSQNGKTYNANIKLVSPNTLKVEGCVMGGVFCGGQEWQRVAQQSAPPPRAKGRGPAASDVCARIAELPGQR